MLNIMLGAAIGMLAMNAACPPRQARGECKARPPVDSGPRIAASLQIKWDPRRDDPAASYDDGKSHPEEAAIDDMEASHVEKSSAWQERATRLRNEGRLGGVDIAQKHADYHHDAQYDGPRERRERERTEKQGKEY